VEWVQFREDLPHCKPNHRRFHWASTSTWPLFKGKACFFLILHLLKSQPVLFQDIVFFIEEDAWLQESVVNHQKEGAQSMFLDILYRLVTILTALQKWRANLMQQKSLPLVGGRMVMSLHSIYFSYTRCSMSELPGVKCTVSLCTEIALSMSTRSPEYFLDHCNSESLCSDHCKLMLYWCQLHSWSNVLCSSPLSYTSPYTKPLFVATIMITISLFLVLYSILTWLVLLRPFTHHTHNKFVGAGFFSHTNIFFDHAPDLPNRSSISFWGWVWQPKAICMESMCNQTHGTWTWPLGTVVFVQPKLRLW
jgi:hypothetical protein